MFQKGRERVVAARPIPFDPDRLAVEAARRDPLRFEALYRKYVAQIYSYALYETRNHHAAEDLTEQVFLHALRGPACPEPLDDTWAPAALARLCTSLRLAARESGTGLASAGIGSR